MLQSFNPMLELSIMVSSGPYTTTDNFTYDPLDEFLIMVKDNTPDAVIMVSLARCTWVSLAMYCI